MFRQLNDSGALASLPFSSNLAGAADAAQERCWPHGSPDLEVSKVVGEVEQSVDELDAGNILADIHAITWRPLDITHSAHSPSLKYAERFGIGADSIKLIKPLTGANHFSFRPMGAAA